MNTKILAIIVVVGAVGMAGTVTTITEYQALAKKGEAALHISSNGVTHQRPWFQMIYLRRV
jgi:hypothetical protein